MRVCSTGFGGIDLLHVSKLVKLMGASYEEVLTQQASVLICDDPQNANVDKLRHTREWGVPAVSADWLWISIQSGQKKPFEPYLVKKHVSQPRKSLERPGAAFTNEATERTQASKSKTPSSNEKTPEDAQTAKQNRNRVMPIMDDGFSNDAEDNAPKPSIPESRSPSPNRNEENVNEDTSAPKEPPAQPKPAAPSALDTALKGLLEQAQAAKARQKNQNQEPTPTTEEGYPQRRKRKPLLGRAPSHTSTKALEGAVAPSRASSIDTLNDDGLGPSLESGDPTRENSLSRTNSRINDQSLSSMFSGGGGKFDFLSDKQPHLNDNEDEENTAPQMTQLDYEDADAAAMRAEFLRDAGKLPSKPKHSDPGLLVDEVREMEDVGWGSRRRTRKHPRDEN